MAFQISRAAFVVISLAVLLLLCVVRHSNARPAPIEHMNCVGAGEALLLPGPVSKQTAWISGSSGDHARSLWRSSRTEKGQWKKLFFAMLPRGNVPPSGPSTGIHGSNN